MKRWQFATRCSVLDGLSERCWLCMAHDEILSDRSQRSFCENALRWPTAVTKVEARDRDTEAARGTGECQAKVTMVEARPAGRSRTCGGMPKEVCHTRHSGLAAPQPHAVAIKSQLIHIAHPLSPPFTFISHQLHLSSYIYGPNSCRIRSRPRA